jgi:hypothetical protein
MTEEEQIEWARFETFAVGQLDSFIDRQNFVGLSINPSFENKERIFVSKAKDGLRWTYKTWESPTDYQRIYSTHDEKMKMKFGRQVPTIKILKGDIGADFYKQTESIIEHLRLPSLVKSDRLGLDGTSYSIVIGDYMRESKYSWWEELPKEWADLGVIFEESKNNLDLARTQLRKKI